MHAAAARLIEKHGEPIDIYNATGGGGRTMTDYGADPDGTVKMVSEQRSRGRTVTDSSGTEVEATVEFRCVIDEVGYGDAYGDLYGGSPQIIPAGAGEPTELERPNGKRYRVMDDYLEDSGVLVLSVVEA